VGDEWKAKPVKKAKKPQNRTSDGMTPNTRNRDRLKNAPNFARCASNPWLTGEGGLRASEGCFLDKKEELS
jgi:hypothetical protein